jgi:hypothetical protein
MIWRGGWFERTISWLADGWACLTARWSALVSIVRNIRVREEAMSQQQRLNEYPALTPVLMDYGWFVAPYINGEEHERIKKLVAYIQANPPADDAAKRAIEDNINKEFLDVAFSV